MILRRFRPTLAVALIMMICAVVVIIDNPNHGNFLSIIATIVLGFGSIPILLGTIHPFVVIVLVGFVGFITAVSAETRVRNIITIKI